MEYAFEVLLTHFSRVVELMIKSLTWRDQKVAMAACDFWSGLTNMPEFAEAVDAINGISRLDE
jgi:hypothetical protein